MEVREMKQLKSLEEESARLKKLLAETCWIRRRFRWHTFWTALRFFVTILR